MHVWSTYWTTNDRAKVKAYLEKKNRKPFCGKKLRNCDVIQDNIWLIGISIAAVHLWNINIAFTVAFVDTLAYLTISAVSYGKILRTLRHQLQVVHAVPQGQSNGGPAPLNIARYKRSVSSAIWAQLALVICYTPFFVVVMLMVYGGMSGGKVQIGYEMTATLAYFNSSLNPFLYCWKIRSVRQAAKDTIKQLNCCKSS